MTELRPAEGQETIQMMQWDTYRAQLRQIIEQGRARNDPTLAVALSLETIERLLDEAEAIEPLLALVRAARLRRNHLLADGDTFGTEEWIAVPRPDFDALRDAVDGLDPAIIAAARKP